MYHSTLGVRAIKKKKRTYLRLIDFVYREEKVEFPGAVERGGAVRARPDLIEKGFQFKTSLAMKFTTQNDLY